MKKLLPLVFLLGAFTSKAQNMYVTDSLGNNVTGQTLVYNGFSGEDEIKTKLLYVHNTSAAPITARCKRTEVSVVINTSTALCWSACSAPYVSGTSVQLLSPGPDYAIPAGDSADLFVLHFYPNNTAGVNLYKIIMFNEDDATDTTGFFVRFDIALGINESQTAQQVKVYPNPANQFLHLDVNYTEPGSTLLISDITGRQIKQTTLTGHTAVAVADLPEGIYMYTVLSAGKAVTANRLVIQH